MRKFLLDAFDLARFRAKSLDHYVYDWRLPIFWVTLLGLLPALEPSALHLGLLGRIVICVGLAWGRALLITLFFTWWLKLNGRWNGVGSLFPIVVLADSGSLLVPLFSLLPDEIALTAIMPFGLYLVAVLVNALSRTTGVKLGHTLLGLLAFLPTAFMLAIMTIQLSISMGWIIPPPVGDNAEDHAAGIEQPAKPATPAAQNDGGEH
ncbi:MAG: hypothetical protein JO142_08845 [Burkholderiales bacterium]|nr:hypothetical protein [Burkholderiales bacterium]